MKIKSVLTLSLCLFFLGSIFSVAFDEQTSGQKQKEKELLQKYRDFLNSTQKIMLPEEREAFMQLATDRERDIYIQSFWKQRKFQGRGRIRDNIRTLMLVKMTTSLDLREEQTAKIFPAISRIEKEKEEINIKIGKELRELRLIVNNENQDQKEISGKINSIKELRNLLKSKDEELEAFLEKNLSLVQQAKYLIFSADFYRDLRDKLERARGMKLRLRDMSRRR